MSNHRYAGIHPLSRIRRRFADEDDMIHSRVYIDDEKYNPPTDPPAEPRPDYLCPFFWAAANGDRLSLRQIDEHLERLGVERNAKRKAP